MKRRTLLKTAALSMAAMALAPLQARARITGPSLKGMITNDAVPDRVNPLNADWMQIIFGPHCWDYSKVYNCKWVLHLYDQIPNPADVALAMAHLSYDHWWILGTNEPDGGGNATPAEYANLVTLQKLAVMQADPNAKFVVSCGMWTHPCWQPNSWFQQMWVLLPGATKKRIYALDTHIYVQGTSPQSEWFLKGPITAAVQPMREWLDVPHSECDYTPNVSQNNPTIRGLWTTEIGLVNDDYTQAHEAEAIQYPVRVQNVMDKWCSRWAWYAMSSHNGYMDLWDNGLTPVGEVFAGT